VFEMSTSDARSDDEVEAPHRCMAGTACRGAKLIEKGEQRAAITEKPDSLCARCRGAISLAFNDITETWLALHMAIGDQTRRSAPKVSGSRTPPINLNTDVDALKMSIVEWLVAAAARVAETLNTDDPHPRNNTDTEHVRVVIACSKLIEPNVDALTAAPADDTMVWLPASETAYPGERKYIDDNGHEHHGVGIVRLTGLQIAHRIVELRRKARSLLAMTAPNDKLSLPCPGCNQCELSRRHILTISGKEVDEIHCGNCALTWPYDRYRQLCLIVVKEDEMERDKLHKQLETERLHRETAEWLLAEMKWHFTLALECRNVSAAEFAAAVLETKAAS
jgi:hypothetical protein